MIKYTDIGVIIMVCRKMQELCYNDLCIIVSNGVSRCNITDLRFTVRDGVLYYMEHEIWGFYVTSINDVFVAYSDTETLIFKSINNFDDVMVRRSIGYKNGYQLLQVGFNTFEGKHSLQLVKVIDNSKPEWCKGVCKDSSTKAVYDKMIEKIRNEKDDYEKRKLAAILSVNAIGLSVYGIESSCGLSFMTDIEIRYNFDDVTFEGKTYMSFRKLEMTLFTLSEYTAINGDFLGFDFLSSNIKKEEDISITYLAGGDNIYKLKGDGIFRGNSMIYGGEEIALDGETCELAIE